MNKNGCVFRSWNIPLYLLTVRSWNRPVRCYGAIDNDTDLHFGRGQNSLGAPACTKGLSAFLYSVWGTGIAQLVPVADCLLVLSVRIPPGAWMFVLCVLYSKERSHSEDNQDEKVVQMKYKKKLVVTGLEVGQRGSIGSILGVSASLQSVWAGCGAYPRSYCTCTGGCFLRMQCG